MSRRENEIGASIADVMPWAGVLAKGVGGLAGGAGGGGQSAPAQTDKDRAEKERLQRQLAEAQAKARTSRIITYTVVGVGGAVTLGTLFYLLLRRR